MLITVIIFCSSYLDPQENSIHLISKNNGAKVVKIGILHKIVGGRYDRGS